MASHRVTVIILLIVLALISLVYLSSETSLFSAIGMNLTGIQPDWSSRWENFVAIQVNSSVKEVRVTLTFGNYKLQDCSQSVYLSDGVDAIPYLLSDEVHTDDLCTETVVEWNNTIYTLTSSEPIETKTYYLYFGPIIQIPVIKPISKPVSGGIPVIVNVGGLAEESHGIATVFVGTPIVTDAVGNIIPANVTLKENGDDVWTSDSGEPLPEGTYDAEFEIGNLTIELNNITILAETQTLLHFDKPMLNISAPENLSWQNMYALDFPLEFSTGRLTSVATGETLWKCEDWNFINRSCDENWTFIKNITAGNNYRMTLTPGDPAWGEAVVSITNETAPMNVTLIPNETGGVRITGKVNAKILQDKYILYVDNSVEDTNQWNDIVLVLPDSRTYEYAGKILNGTELGDLIGVGDTIDVNSVNTESITISYFNFFSAIDGYVVGGQTTPYNATYEVLAVNSIS